MKLYTSIQFCILVYKIPRSLNWNRSFIGLTNWNRMKFLAIHTKRCVYSKFFSTSHNDTFWKGVSQVQHDLEL